MALRTLGFVAVYGVGLVLTLFNPVYGVLTYFFEWHNHPPYFWWGEQLPDLRCRQFADLGDIGCKTGKEPGHTRASGNRKIPDDYEPYC